MHGFPQYLRFQLSLSNRHGWWPAFCPKPPPTLTVHLDFWQSPGTLFLLISRATLPFARLFINWFSIWKVCSRRLANALSSGIDLWIFVKLIISQFKSGVQVMLGPVFPLAPPKWTFSVCHWTIWKMTIRKEKKETWLIGSFGYMKKHINYSLKMFQTGLPTCTVYFETKKILFGEQNTPQRWITSRCQPCPLPCTRQFGHVKQSL